MVVILYLFLILFLLLLSSLLLMLTTRINRLIKLTDSINKEVEIYKSMVIDFEISKIKLDNKRRQVEDLYDAMELSQITYAPEIKQRALELKQFNIKDMDALHLSFAESTDIDYFITTDRLLINASKRANLRIKVINPIEFIMEVI